MLFVEYIMMLLGIAFSWLESWGFGFKLGISASRSPSIFHTIQNFSGSSAMTDQIFLAMGLYFFLVTTLHMVTIPSGNKEIGVSEACS